MEKQEQRERNSQSVSSSGRDRRVNLEGLPMEESPYVQYKDLEDYKRQGYGAEGHLQPQPGRGAGATEGPTLSGAAATSNSEAKLAATDAINRQGVP